MLTMKFNSQSIVGLIVLSLGMALILLNFVTWPQSLNSVPSIYQSDNPGKF